MMLIDEDIILQSTPISHGLSICALFLGLNKFLNHTRIAVRIFYEISYDCVLLNHIIGSMHTTNHHISIYICHGID